MSSAQQLDHYRRLSREAKRRRTGICADCGTVTRYNGHSAVVSERCPECAHRRNGELKRGVGHRQQQLRALLKSGPMRYSEIRDHLGVTSQHTTVLLGRAMRYGHVRRVARGVYALADAEAA